MAVVKIQPYWIKEYRDLIKRAEWTKQWLESQRGKKSRKKTYKKYYKNHKEERKALSKLIQKRTKGIAQKKWNLNNKEKRQIIDYNYNHSDTRKAQLQTSEYKQRIRAYMKLWRLTPNGIESEKKYYLSDKAKLTRLKAQTKYLNKLSDLFNNPKEYKIFTMFEIQYALSTWSNYIKTRDKICQICGTKNSLIAHHIFYKILYSKLCLNPNNGITLCKACHLELHFGTLGGLGLLR